jgi:hypothetical protein
MHHRPGLRAAALGLAAAGLLAACATGPQTGPMSFFVTSTGVGRGADLGGRDGADAHCQKLAAASGAPGAAQRKWRAYLSASPAAQGAPAVNARDRIGKGPWFNAKGQLIARDVEQLHGANQIVKASALDERGNPVKGRGDTPNEHDILTGSRLDGTAFSPAFDLTCRNWTSSGEGQAMVGHHDRSGLVQDAWALSWNSSHFTRGCSQDQLRSTGGAGLFYCFAAD